MKAKELPYLAYLQSRLDYDPDTGIICWRAKPIDENFNGWNHRFAGKKAGVIAKHGYLFIRICGEIYLGHRIAWVLGTETKLPIEVQIDHIDKDRSNNRLANLRIATTAQNSQNSFLIGQRTTNFDLPRNVYPSGNSFRVALSCEGKYHYCGSYSTVEEATQVAAEARATLHKEFAAK